MHIQNGQTIQARERGWTVACAPEGDTGLLIADPHLTEKERKRIESSDRIFEQRGTFMPSNVYVQRDVLDVSEVQAA
jgi:hypothetical protein